MNKYNLREFLQSELADHASSLKETSYDKENGEYLCKDTATPNVYDFDAYVQEHCDHPIPASPDAIHVGSKDLYFIEFKNQYAADVDRTQMRRKFEAGTSILKKLLLEFAPKDCRYHFCVVLEDQPKSRFMDFRHIEQNVIKFGLAELNQEMGNFYDHVVTESVGFYVKEFKSLLCV